MAKRLSHTPAALGSLRLMSLLVLAALLFAVLPDKAVAAVALNKDGLEKAAVADCVIDYGSLRNCTFTASAGSPFVLDTNTGTFTEQGTSTVRGRYGVYIDYTPTKGETTLPGYFDLTYPQALLDNQGSRHDLIVRVSNVRTKWGYDTNTGRVRQLLLSITTSALRLLAEPGCLLKSGSPCYQGWQNGTYNAAGITCDVSIWNGDGANLKYNLYAQDLDQPDRFTANLHADCKFASYWSESYVPSGSFSDFHVRSDTYLATDGSRIYGTRTDDDEDTGHSAFVCIGTMGGSSKPLKFTWRGSSCSTRILQDWAYTLRTRVINAVGGTIYARTGNSTAIESTRGGDWTSTRTVPRNDYLVTATPDEGYYISGMWLNGQIVSDAEIAQGAVSVARISRNNDVSVQFKKIPPTTARLSIVKTSECPSITDDNPCYTLEGATYQVFRDEGCTDLVATLTTAADGTTEPCVLAAGAYYVRESSAPTGYALDGTTHTVTIVAGVDQVLELADPPLAAPIDIVAHKVDQASGEAWPQGDASLAGAEFRVDFHAGRYAADDLPEEPLRSWTVRTDDAGTARLDAASLVEGDEFYSLADAVVMPLGTIAVRETKAPVGYLLPEDAAPKVYHVALDREDVRVVCDLVADGDRPAVADPVICGGVKLKKVDATTGEPLEGAVFAITNASAHPVIVGDTAYATGEVCLRLTSDTNGIAQTPERALPYGTYRITETQAPTGFHIDTSWSQTLSVTEDGIVVDLTSEPLSNRLIETSVPILAKKHFDGSSQGRTLEDGMFSFELIDSKGVVLQKKTCDAQGDIAFDPLAFSARDAGKTFSYTMREVRGTDEEIVYDTHIEQLSVSLRLEDDERLVAELVTDEDGLAFHNSTVGSIVLPLTGQAGIRTAAPGVVIALAAGGTLARRLKTHPSRRRRR